MKKIIFSNAALLLFFMMATLSSCLKDKGYEDGLYGAVRGTEGSKWVSIPKGTKAANVVAVEASSQPQNIPLFQASFDYVNAATSDITVKLKLRNSMVTDYDPTALPLPANSYTTPSMTLTIPAGKRLSDVFSLSLSTSLLDPTEVYGIGLEIETVTPSEVKVAATLNKVLFMFNVKNKYDARYTVTGTMVDNASASLTGYFPMTYDLVTAGTQVVEGFDPFIWGDYFIPIRSGTAVSGYGAFSPVFTFDATNKITSVVNIYGQPSGNGRYAQLDPSGENSWDPATKTIKVKFFMFQPSVVPLPSPRVLFNWTMTYLSPRP
jgi:hypothetical protein